MIVITTGTHGQPFDRLVAAGERLAVELGEEVRIQRGSSRVITPHCRSEVLLPWSDLDRWMGEARVVICHTGPATVFQAAAHGHVPIVVPRAAARGEHVDDHQRAFGEWLNPRVHWVEDPAALVEEVRRHEALVGSLLPLTASDDERARSAIALGELVTAVAQHPRRRYKRIRQFLSYLGPSLDRT